MRSGLNTSAEFCSYFFLTTHKNTIKSATDRNICVASLLFGGIRQIKIMLSIAACQRKCLCPPEALSLPCNACDMLQNKNLYGMERVISWRWNMRVCRSNIKISSSLPPTARCILSGRLPCLPLAPVLARRTSIFRNVSFMFLVLVRWTRTPGQ
jgi:hypothetical protein